MVLWTVTVSLGLGSWVRVVNMSGVMVMVTTQNLNPDP